MARRITTTEEATEQPGKPDTGAVFVKNQLNELLKFEDGTTYKFGASRTVVEDPELAEKIRALAAKPGNPHGIFESK